MKPINISHFDFVSKDTEDAEDCPGAAWGIHERGAFRDTFLPILHSVHRGPTHYSAGWEESVPQLGSSAVSSLTEKMKHELHLTLLQITINQLEKKIHRLESIQTKIVPIDSFAPEPYLLSRPIYVALHSIEGGFNAGWFDANIHSSGENEEEAASNLKSLILDFFDILTGESPSKLGPEPTRQLAVLTDYIRKRQ